MSHRYVALGPAFALVAGYTYANLDYFVALGCKGLFSGPLAATFRNTPLARTSHAAHENIETGAKRKIKKRVAHRSSDREYSSEHIVSTPIPSL